MAATGFLLSFDVYGRGTDMVQALRQELRPPQGSPAGAAANLWTLTLFPATQTKESKTYKQDVTKAIGGTDPRRRLLTGLCGALMKRRATSPLLLGMLEHEYVSLPHRARLLAGLAPSHPHRMRHGGASADGLLPSISDATSQERGGWTSPKSVAIYRQPARYLRQLQLLTAQQKMSALTASAAIRTMVVTFLRAR